jgi:hypothetical protein
MEKKLLLYLLIIYFIELKNLNKYIILIDKLKN